MLNSQVVNIQDGMPKTYEPEACQIGLGSFYFVFFYKELQ